MFKNFSTLTKGQKIFLLVWAAFILVAGVMAQSRLSHMESANLQASILKHKDRIDPNVTESGKTEPERTPPAGHENDIPLDVKIGVYMDRVPALSIRDSLWTADFYIWFTWQDDSLHPGDTFQVVNGEILSRTKLEEKKRMGNTTPCIELLPVPPRHLIQPASRATIIC